MTAPCQEAEDGFTACFCPTYTGTFQIGQKFDGIQCDIAPNVWTAADNMLQTED